MVRTCSPTAIGDGNRGDKPAGDDGGGGRLNGSVGSLIDNSEAELALTLEVHPADGDTALVVDELRDLGGRSAAQCHAESGGREPVAGVAFAENPEENGEHGESG